MLVDITDKEKLVLRQVLETYEKNLKGEIHKTDDRELRGVLHGEDDVLLGLLKKVA
jgi:hypothetical protein